MKHDRKPKYLQVVIISLSLMLLLGGLARAARAQSGAADWLVFGSGDTRRAPEVSLLQADAQTITLRVDADGVNIGQVQIGGQNYLSLSGEGFGTQAEVGAPALPVILRDVEVPFGAQVSVEILSATSKSTSLADLGLEGVIAPRQPSQSKCAEAQNVEPPNSQIYGLQTAYPGELVRVVDEYIARGHRVVQLEIAPVQYTPASGGLETFSQIEFLIRLDGSDMAATYAEADRLNSKGFNDLYAAKVLNYNQGRPLELPKDPEKYLIITADAYESGLAALVSLKQSQGFNVSVANITTVGGNTTTAIKNYIKTQYQGANPPDYVLLVGDYNNGADSITNYQFRTGGSSRTDLYFFTMDNETEFVPDIFYGRFPVRNSTQLANMVAKLQTYAARSGQEAWVKKAAFLATSDGGWYDVAEATHNYVINSYTLPKGYSGFFPTNPMPGGDKLYAITHSATTTDVTNAINDDRAMVVYSGHGSQTSWAGPSFTQTNVRNLTGVAVPYVASHACVTGDFTIDESFADTWVIEPVNGALTIAAASNNSYWDEDDILERVTFDLLYSDPTGAVVPSVAEMKHGGLVAVDASGSSLDQYYWEEYHIFGDPSLEIVLGPRLPDFSLSFQPSVIEICSTDTDQVTINVSSVNQYDDPVALAASPLAGFELNFEPSGPIAPPAQVALSLFGDGTAPSGAQVLTVTGTSGSLTHQADLLVNVYNPLSAGPQLALPVNGAANVAPGTSLSWQPLERVLSYHLKVALDASFTQLIIDEQDITATSFTPSAAFQTDTRYYWTVSAENPCGETNANQSFSFRTRPGPGDCPAGTTAQTLYLSDFEDGAPDWSDTSSGSYHWALSTARSHSPLNSWTAAVPAVIADQRLVSPAFALPANDLPLSLSFWHRWTFDNPTVCNDGAILEVSTNNGVSWVQVSASKLLTNAYSGTVRSGVFNPLAGKSAWCGTSDWVWTVADLSEYAGQTVLFRFRLGSGNSGSAEGWYLDDVKLQSCVAEPVEESLIYLPWLSR